MLTWLVDNLTTVYLILTVLALGWIFVVWLIRQNARKKPANVSLLLVLGLGPLLVFAMVGLFLAFTIQTDQKLIEGAVTEMMAGIKAKDSQRVFAQVSEDFRYGGQDRERARAFLDMNMRNGNIEEVVVWDFEDVQVSQPKEGKATATISFKVKPKGNWSQGAEFFQCNAEFVRDADGKWRLRGFKIMNPANNQEIGVPGA